MRHTLLYTYSDLQTCPHSFLNAFKYWRHLLSDSRILADGSQFKQPLCKDCPRIAMDIVRVTDNGKHPGQGAGNFGNPLVLVLSRYLKHRKATAQFLGSVLRHCFITARVAALLG